MQPAHDLQSHDVSPQFIIQFPAPKQKLYRWMGRFILLGSSILYLGVTEPSQLKYGWPALGLLFLLLDLTGVSLLTQGLSLQVFAWIMADQWIMAGALLVLSVLHRLAMQQQRLSVDPSGITFHFPWKRTLKWNAIEFIILKDGMLTIENRNGRVLQQPIEKDSTLREADFNEFCQQQCKT